MPAGDLSTTKQFTNGQLGVDGSDLNQIMSQASVNPSFYTAQSNATSPGDSDILLLLSSGGTYEKVLYSNFFSNSKWLRQAPGGGPQWVSTINGQFDVWQWGNSFPALLNNTPSATYTADRFVVSQTWTAATGQCKVTQQNLTTTFPASANAPNPRYAARVTVTASGTPNAGDFVIFSQKVEYRQARKLFKTVTSLSIWLKASVAGTYSIVIQDSVQGQSYKQDFNIGTPNVWTECQIQNIPIFNLATGNFGTAETDLSYIISVVIAAGSTFQSATQDSWLTGNFLNTSASANPLLSTNGATLDITLWQHESGAVCTPFEPDPDYASTLEKCQRYYAQSYDDIAGNFAGNTGDNNYITVASPSTALIPGTVLPTSMRVAPTVTIYNPVSGAANSVRINGGSNIAVNSLVVGRKAIANITLNSALGTGWAEYHYTASAEL
jgi:hypothetical protein